MPPKKKKLPVNLVVGTVSTRSTRRQSIVNIEIPKLSRTNKSTTKTVKVSKYKRKVSGQDEENVKEFTEIIKKSNKLPGTSIENSPTLSKTSQEALDKDNRALLEILQDWDDEDEDQTENSTTSSSTKSDINETAAKKYSTNISELSENKQMELMLSEGLEDIDEESKDIKSCHGLEESDDNKSINDDLSIIQDDNQSSDVNFEAKNDNLVPIGDGVQTEPEEVIIEENASIPYADDIIVDDTQKIDDASMTSYEDKVITDNSIVTEEAILEENIEFSEIIQVEENISENSQSSTVADQVFITKNDEMVSVQVEINEQSQDMECMPIEEEQIDKNQDFEVQNYAQDDNNINLEQFNSSVIEGTNEESNLTCSSENAVDGTLLQQVEKMECEIETPTQPSEYNENQEVVGLKYSENSKEVKSNFLLLSQEKKQEIYENLENKVAEMNLTDETLNQKPSEDIANDVEEIIDKVKIIDVKSGITPKKSTPKKEVKMVQYTDLKVTKEHSKQPQSKKAKDTSSKLSKTEQEQKITKSVKVKSSKTYKPPTFKIKRDKKPKEPRNKNQPNEKSTKKFKDKFNFKETEKSDKKLTKFEEALQNIGKPDDGDEVRRSSRIKSISVMNRKTSGWGVVKSKSETSLNDGDISDSNSFHTESDKSTPTASPKVSNKDRKTKSGSINSESTLQLPAKVGNQVVVPFKSEDSTKIRPKDPVVEARLKQFVHLKENSYKTDRMACKEAKKMACDCFLTQEELENNEYGCGEDCLNRLLLIECGNLCTVGDRCTNKRFQKSLFAPVEVFNTDKKGLGLRAAANIPFGEFILEYVGEVLNSDEFDKRAEVYSQDKNIHYYFMALRVDAIIDATMKGNISRFINHSCDPNAETQKWTVNGELRIGFFSTRTILAGEEITFDYRFQRYGKEAQKCYCGASICRGWLGEQPDSDEEEEEEEEEEPEEIKPITPVPHTKDEMIPCAINAEVKDEIKMEVTVGGIEGKPIISELPSQDATVLTTPKLTPVKKKVYKKKPRIEMFEEIDQLNEEIEMVVTTGLKNQAHTLKLSRLMVRAKEPQQRAKLLRVLRRGELPCRRLFLDYHGLRLMHGYMIDAQQLVISNKKFESLRLEMLQTLAVLPIPNKTMLQDSKVLSTVEKWSTNKDLTSPEDSESNSPKDTEPTPKPVEIKEENKESIKEEQFSDRSIEDQEEEIKFLASKLLEEWKNLKEVFRIPKKERIEQMKEHEREANKKFMQTNQNTYGSEDDRKMDRYRGIAKGKVERDQGINRRPPKPGDKPSAEFLRLSKFERRKLFALQHELKEEERKLKQREMWREHEMNCMMIGADPRFTAPFDPSRGYQYIWNQNIAQWQTLPIQSNTRLYPQPPPLPQIPNLNVPPPHLAKPHLPGYQFTSPMNIPMVLNQPPQAIHMPPLPQTSVQGQMPPLPGTNISQLYHGQAPIQIPTPPLPQMPPPPHQIEEDPSQVKFMGPIPPPAKLPPKWKCAKDKYGRPYYYHIKLRKSQWEPPPPPPPEPLEVSESESSSESSTVSSDSSSENSDSDDDIDDTRLLLEVRRQMDSLPKPTKSLPIVVDNLDDIPAKTPSPDEKHSEGEMSVDDFKHKNVSLEEEIIRRPSIDMRLKELDLFKDDRPPKKRRRAGLCEEIIISPRTEEDKKQFKEDLKRYKANKEKLKRQKEKILQQTKKQLREIEIKKAKEKRSKTTVKVKLKEKPDFNSEAAKKIKEAFRTNMASTVVSSLNGYRRPDCTEGRITNTQDFKHLARKLTHFVMLKEMKHITKIEELTCTDNVKMKAREFIRKYMSKFGEVYVKRSDSPDFKD